MSYEFGDIQNENSKNTIDSRILLIKSVGWME